MKEALILLMLALLILPLLGAVRRIRRLPRGDGQKAAARPEGRPTAPGPDA